MTEMTTTPAYFTLNRDGKVGGKKNAPPLRYLCRATLLCTQLLTLSAKAFFSPCVFNDAGSACTI